jgi:hypothetical protein
MSHHNIGSGQYIFLFYLYNHNGSTQDEISKALDMDKATTTRAVQTIGSTTSSSPKRATHSGKNSIKSPWIGTICSFRILPPMNVRHCKI